MELEQKLNRLNHCGLILLTAGQTESFEELFFWLPHQPYRKFAISYFFFGNLNCSRIESWLMVDLEKHRSTYIISTEFLCAEMVFLQPWLRHLCNDDDRQQNESTQKFVMLLSVISSLQINIKTRSSFVLMVASCLLSILMKMIAGIWCKS